MKKAVFYVATLVFLIALASSCKDRPKIGDDLNECRSNCNTGSLDGDTACLDRCNCYHTSGQEIKKCNTEYDEAISTD